MFVISLSKFADAGAIQAEDVAELSITASDQWSVFREATGEEQSEVRRKIFSNQAAKWHSFKSFIEQTHRDTDTSDFDYVYILNRLFRSLELFTYPSDIGKRIRKGEAQELTRWSASQMNESRISEIINNYETAIVTVGIVRNTARDQGEDIKSYKDMMGTINSSTTALRSQIGDAQVKMAEISSGIIGLQSDTIPTITKLVSELSEEVSDAKAKASEEVDAATSEFRERWQKFQTLVNSQIVGVSLQVPSKKWREDAKKHGRNSVISLAIGCAMAVLCIYMMPKIAHQAIQVANEIITQPEFALAKLIFSGTIILIFITFSLWATRIAVQYYMTEQHLRNDCENRAAVTEAFINLQTHMGSTFDATVLLSTLMRPAQDGMVKDDLLPPTLPVALILSQLEELKKKAS